ncbi:MAG TPA: hypothetical protein VGA29_02080, partial [Ignavibacteriaceae bacterium]
MKNSLLLKNCLLYNSSDNSSLVDILIEDSKISFVDKPSLLKSPDETIDVNGRIAAPGLIDIHIQGAGGADILDGTEDALLTIARTLARTGTTSYLGTTVVKPKENNYHLKVAKRYVNKFVDGATLSGFH